MWYAEPVMRMKNKSLKPEAGRPQERVALILITLPASRMEGSMMKERTFKVICYVKIDLEDYEAEGLVESYVKDLLKEGKITIQDFTVKEV